MRNFLVACQAVILSACVVSPGESLRRGSPVIELTSDRTAKAVAICIADRWENLGPPGQIPKLYQRPETNGYTVFLGLTYRQYTYLQSLVEIRDVPDGSKSEYFEGKFGSSPPGVDTDALATFAQNTVKECQ